MTKAIHISSVEARGTRSKALVSAEELLHAGGHEAVTLRQIADRAGVGIGTLYHYFRGKDDLFVHLAVEGFRQLRLAITAAGSAGSEASLQRAAEAFLTFAEDRPALMVLMFDDRRLRRSPLVLAAECECFVAYRCLMEADDRIPSAHKEDSAVAFWVMGRGVAAFLSSSTDESLRTDTVRKLLSWGRWFLDGRR